jgi:putative ABC transport system permease protein
VPRLLTYALRSLWVRRTTTLATAGALTMLVFVLAASGMLASGMQHTVAHAGSPQRALVLQHDAYAEHNSRVPQSVLGLVAAAAGVRRDAQGTPLVTGETVAHVMLGEGTGRLLSTLQVRGVDANVFQLRPQVRVVSGRALQPGTAEAIAGRGIAERVPGAALGSALELAPGRAVHIVGVFESGGSVLESELWVDLNTARDAFGLQGHLSSVTAELESTEAYDSFAAPLTEDKQSDVDVTRESAYYAKLSDGVSTLIAMLGVVEAVIFSLGAACATMLVFYAAVAQRRSEVAVLRAIGFARRSIIAAFLAESVALALVGGACGVGLALLTPLLDFHTVNFATGQDVTFHFRPELKVLARAFAAAAATGIVGGLLPAVQAARLDPVLALRA